MHPSAEQTYHYSLMFSLIGVPGHPQNLMDSLLPKGLEFHILRI